jgi:Uncharacterized protein conserved in bacteria
MTGPGLTVIYDGECPFCASYLRLVRLREAVGRVELVDARSTDPRVAMLCAEGYDLDAGMIALWEGQVFYGDAAVHLLATLSAEGSGILNRIQKMLFASPDRAAQLYPVLVFGRRAFLRLAGRIPIGMEQKSSNGSE